MLSDSGVLPATPHANAPPNAEAFTLPAKDGRPFAAGVKDQQPIGSHPIQVDDTIRVRTTKLDALMETMKRWGIARKFSEYGHDDMDDAALGHPYAVIIRPAIADLLGETALSRLVQFKSTATAAAVETEGEVEQNKEMA